MAHTNPATAQPTETELLAYAGDVAEAMGEAMAFDKFARALHAYSPEMAQALVARLEPVHREMIRLVGNPKG